MFTESTSTPDTVDIANVYAKCVDHLVTKNLSNIHSSTLLQSQVH